MRTICPCKWPNRTVREGLDLPFSQFQPAPLPGRHTIPACLPIPMVIAVPTHAPAVKKQSSVPTKKPPHLLWCKCGGCLFIIRIVIKGLVVQLIEIKEFCQSHIECRGDLVECFHTGVLGQTSDDIVLGGLLHIAHAPSLLIAIPRSLHSLRVRFT